MTAVTTEQRQQWQCGAWAMAGKALRCQWTTTTKQTSHRRKRGRTPMGEGINDPMTAWHWLGGSQRHPMPTPTVGGRRHQTT